MKSSLASFLPAIEDRALVGLGTISGIVLLIGQSKTLSFAATGDSKHMTKGRRMNNAHHQ
jgi:hypothetical protein